MIMIESIRKELIKFLQIKAKELDIEFEGSIAKNPGIIQLDKDSIEISVGGQKDLACKIAFEISRFLNERGIPAIPPDYKLYGKMTNIYIIRW